MMDGVVMSFTSALLFLVTGIKMNLTFRPILEGALPLTIGFTMGKD